ncbi:MAG TPA: SIMPL domain-containing protein [Candidatus Acidoferrales bacterium]|nr:SIMPL domain-containing protein [Candidatus Acidoferrales bacterium]
MNKTLCLLAAFFALSAAGSPAATVTHITVTGSGTAAVTPDEALIRASIVTDAQSAQAAVSQNNVLYAKVVNAVAASGVARNDITLAYYNVNYNPRPSPQPAGPILEGRFGYIVTRAFDVKVRAIDRTGAVVDALTGAGTTNVENVNFQASNTAHARSEAIAAAFADAHAKAENAAQAAGLHLTGISRMSFGGVQTVAPMARVMTAMAPAPTAFDQGSVNVTVELTVIFLAAP